MFSDFYSAIFYLIEDYLLTDKTNRHQTILADLEKLFLETILPFYNAKFQTRESILTFLQQLKLNDRKAWFELLFLVHKDSRSYQKIYTLSPFREKNERLFVTDKQSLTLFSLDQDLECLESALPQFVTMQVVESNI